MRKPWDKGTQSRQAKRPDPYLHSVRRSAGPCQLSLDGPTQSLLEKDVAESFREKIWFLPVQQRIGEAVLFSSSHYCRRLLFHPEGRKKDTAYRNILERLRFQSDARISHIGKKSSDSYAVLFSTDVNQDGFLMYKYWWICKKLLSYNMLKIFDYCCIFSCPAKRVM